MSLITQSKLSAPFLSSVEKPKGRWVEGHEDDGKGPGRNSSDFQPWQPQAVPPLA